MPGFLARCLVVSSLARILTDLAVILHDLGPFLGSLMPQGAQTLPAWLIVGTVSCLLCVTAYAPSVVTFMPASRLLHPLLFPSCLLLPLPHPVTLYPGGQVSCRF